MVHLKLIEKMQPQEVREYVKSHADDESFISEVVENKDQAIPLLLKNKAISDAIVTKLSCSVENILFLLDSFIEFNFVPSLDFIDCLISYGSSQDGNLLKLINAFPSIPLSAPFLIRLINDGLIESAVELVKRKKEFQKPDVAYLILKSGCAEELIVKLGSESKEVVDKIFDDICENKGTSFCKEILSNVILQSDVKKMKIEKVTSLNLRADALEIIIKHNNQVKREENANRPYDGNRKEIKKTEIAWSQELEDLDSSLLIHYLVNNAPPASKFRTNFIIRKPKDGSDEELLEVLRTKSGVAAQGVAEEIIKRSVSLIKEAGIDQIAEVLSPSMLAEAARGSHEKLIFCYNEFPSKYHQALTKVAPAGLFSKQDKTVSRKKSYFHEAFAALKGNNLQAFREALSHGYSIERFAQDTNQSSKSRSCELVSIGSEMIYNFTKDELLALASTPFGFIRNYDNENELKFSISVAEAVFLRPKFYICDLFDACDNKVKFLLCGEVDKEDIVSIMNHRQELIISDKTLLKAFFQRTDEPLNVTSEVIKELAPLFSQAELEKAVKTDSYEQSEVLNLKCKDGLYFISDEMVLDLLTEKSNLENQSFISALYIRNKELVEKMAEAYLKGNKEMSEVLGRPVSIRRSKKQLFNNLVNELTEDTSKVVDSIFEKGGKFSDFESQLLNWEDSLLRYSKGRIIHLPEITWHKLSEYNKLETLNFKAECLVVDCHHEYGFDEIKNRNVEVDSIKLKDISEFNPENESLIQFIKKMNVTIVLEEARSSYFASKVQLIRKNIHFVGWEEVINSVTNGIEDLNGLTAEDFDFLVNHGLLVDSGFVNKVLNSWHSSNIDRLRWLCGRIGGFKKYKISESLYDFYNEEEKSELKGIEVLSDSDYKLWTTKECLLDTGASFEPIDISNFTIKQKMELIKFIETKIDPNYSKLVLSSSNLDSLEELRCFKEMEAPHTFNDEELCNLFCIPTNISQNKKVIKGIKDLLAIKGQSFAYKVDDIQTCFEILNPTVELQLSDFIDYSNPANVVENEYFSMIKPFALNFIIQYADSIKAQGLILKNKGKQEILRFLRSASSHDSSYLKDTLDMVNSASKGLHDLEVRINTLLAAEETEEVKQEIFDLKNTRNSVSIRLTEVAAMDEVVHMHDRLVPLLSFLKNDSHQPLGQDKFDKFENSRKVVDKLGYALYFPKTRGDLHYLGSTNDWCVSTHSFYGDGVIEKGNILVGVCEAGKPSAMENVIALAHYLKDQDGEYRLEQFRWSKKIKGSGMVNATYDFNHEVILASITEHLREYESKKRV